MLYNKPPENTVDYNDNHIFSWFGGQTGVAHIVWTQPSSSALNCGSVWLGQLLLCRSSFRPRVMAVVLGTKQKNQVLFKATVC